MVRPSVLVVDDDEAIRTYLTHLLTSRGYATDSVDSGAQAIARVAGGLTPAVAIVDIMMPGVDGLEVLARLKGISPSLPVIILSAVGQAKTVVDAMKMGASDYLVKPFEEHDLQLAIENALEKQKLKDEVRILKKKLDRFTEHAEILSTNTKMIRLKEIAKQVADTDVPVLIMGESGVGKEVMARFIYSQSSRRDKAFIKVNCAALPHELLESELFGHERGAFTGAHNEKPGKFELADKGVLLLDEIGEMSPHLQAKLLHVLQDGEFSRLGAKHSIRVDVRIVASTNRRLEEAVGKGEFRADLYFRLNVIRLTIPPLRERREDIPVLWSYFLQRYSEKYKSSVQQLPAELLDTFLRYDWPGNVRQLENAIKRYVILPDLELALTELHSQRMQGPEATVEASVSPRGVSLKEISGQAAETAERELVMRVLDETNWNRKEAARRLDICYKALLNKLKKWQVGTRRTAIAP
jgi:two-component system, NtrC family, response regulator AtoC